MPVILSRPPFQDRFPAGKLSFVLHNCSKTKKISYTIPFENPFYFCKKEVFKRTIPYEKEKTEKSL